MAYARLTTPDIITIREGQALSLGLELVGLFNHQVSWSYYTTVSGGTAQNSDIGGASGSGSTMIVSSSPQTKREPFSISATQDDIQEAVETAYLVVQVNGTWGFSFEDGNTYKTIEIQILDDNLTAGGTGNDVLRGTSAAEDLTGGAGNDTYHITAGDQVVELSDGGTDTVHSSFTYTLAQNVENLTLTGNAAVNGTGNLLANRLTGNGAANQLVGGIGADSLFGNGGNDTLRGDIDNDLLEGGAGNDWLDGGTGVDILRGGAGDDVYDLDSAADVVSEMANQGTDMVRAAFGLTLSSHVENLTLLGTTNIGGTGNALNNTLKGNTGANRLDGAAGNDWLDGGTGIDTLRGGMGNDTYAVDNARDQVVEGAKQGTDTVRSSIVFQLSANVENLILTGRTAIKGTGNALSNSLTGNEGTNLLSGLAGNDTLNGGRGQDTIIGGAGSDQLSGGLDAVRDVFIFNALSDSAVGTGRDRILDLRSGIDDIDLRVLDANTRAAGNQAFDFSGTTAAANSVWYVKAGANLVVRADVNGDKVADFELAVLGQTSLGAGDFLL